MKILEVKIDWMEKWSNPPRARVLVDCVPSYSEMLYTKRGNIYFAEKDGYVSFFYYHKPGPGYGGRRFTLHMQDGSTETLIGPWSSSPSAVQKEGFPSCMDVSITDDPKVWDQGYTFYAAHMLTDSLSEAINHLTPDATVMWRQSPIPFSPELNADQSLVVGGTKETQLEPLIVKRKVKATQQVKP